MPSDVLGPAMTNKLSDTDLKILAELEKKILWLSSWTIHNANHLRENVNGLTSCLFLMI